MIKSKQITSYDQRFERVTDYIANHLTQEIDLFTLAEVAHLSSYHFHRVYHAISGETIANTVKRLRLEKAVNALVQTQLSIKEIAKQSGFQSIAVFTRVFKLQYGFPPAQYRLQGSHLRFVVPEQRRTLHGEIRLLELPALDGVQRTHHGSYLHIARAFNPLFRWAQSSNTMPCVTHVIGIYPDDPFSMPEKQLTSHACLIFDSPVLIPANLEPIKISGGLHAVLRHQGPYADMRLAYQWLYGEWLPKSGYLVADSPVFEIYLNHPRDTVPRDLMVDICLPIQAL